MPADALYYSFIASELHTKLALGRIEKIQLPFKDTVVLIINSNKTTHRLLISCNPSSPRCHITNEKFENPYAAPTFLMHLKKHILNARVLSVSLVPYERVLVFDLDCKNELGFSVSKKLYAEIMGKYSNIILANDDEKVTDCCVHVTPDLSSKRVVLPGCKYALPPKQNKIELSDERTTSSLLGEFNGGRLDEFILSRVSGLSPKTICEAICRVNLDKNCDKLSSEKIIELAAKLTAIYDLKSSQPCTDNKDFYPYEFLSQSNGKWQYFQTHSEALDSFYKQRDDRNNFSQKTKNLHTAIKNAVGKCEKKLVKLSEKEQDAKNLENDKLFGELITSNLYRLKNNMDSANLLNYYTNEEIAVPLNRELSPQQNAQRYYKIYNKKKKTLESILTQRDETEKKLDYFQSILLFVGLCENEIDILELTDELIDQGLIEKKKQNKKQIKPSKLFKVEFEGYTITVGKNNFQNDAITKKAKAQNLWLHTKSIHGSHVVIDCDSLPPENVIRFAAEIAAYQSKARLSQNVPVDYTFIKYVNKPSGSPLGKVVYTNQKTIYVNPQSGKTT